MCCCAVRINLSRISGERCKDSCAGRLPCEGLAYRTFPGSGRSPSPLPLVQSARGTEPPLTTKHSPPHADYLPYVIAHSPLPPPAHPATAGDTTAHRLCLSPSARSPFNGDAPSPSRFRSAVLRGDIVSTPATPPLIPPEDPADHAYSLGRQSRFLNTPSLDLLSSSPA